MKKIILSLLVLILFTGCNEEKKECCTCLDCPSCDVCCSCTNPYINQNRR